jgi:type II secretion system protein N
MWLTRRPLIVSGYLGYAVVLFALCTYLKFPSQQIRGFVLTMLSQYGLEQVRIGSVRPLLPAGLAFTEVSVTHDVKGQALELMRLPELQLQLHTFPLFATRGRIGVTGGLYGGVLSGMVEWEQNGQGPLVGIHVDLQDFRPAAHPLVARLANAVVEGKLAGRLDLQLPHGRWQDGDGRLTVRSEAGSITGLALGGVRIPALSYEQLAVEFALQQRTVVVREFQLKGRDWQIDILGNLGLNEPLDHSLIDLTIRIRASEAMEQQLGFVGMFLRQRRDRRGFTTLKISGTLERPSPAL